MRLGKLFSLLHPVKGCLAACMLAGSLVLPAAEKDTLERLPDVSAGGFRKLAVQPFKKNGKTALYRANNGLLFRIYAYPPEACELTGDLLSSSTKTLIEQDVKELEKELVKISGSSGPVKREFCREQSFGTLAGMKLTGYLIRYTFMKGKNPLRMEVFAAPYRGNLLKFSLITVSSRIREDVHKNSFLLFASGISASLNQGERCQLPEPQKKIVEKAFRELLQDPLHSLPEANALISFVNHSSMVIVQVKESDVPWQKNLMKHNKKYARLLLAAFLGGNAMQQIREGVCANRRDAGLAAAGKVYGKIKAEDKAFYIPELEK